ncbi:unnamed protein product [Lupinus luteus]|uniref:Uncharacterized protein n=1 Tax=Lupinus luteus TaxID=3873 RepID=A0AAV1Y764_LUPLU
MAPYAGPRQMMHYGLGPLDMPFGRGLPPDSFGMQGYMMPPVPPHMPTLLTKVHTAARSCCSAKHELEQI